MSKPTVSVVSIAAVVAALTALPRPAAAKGEIKCPPGEHRVAHRCEKDAAQHGSSNGGSAAEEEAWKRYDLALQHFNNAQSRRQVANDKADADNKRIGATCMQFVCDTQEAALDLNKNMNAADQAQGDMNAAVEECKAALRGIHGERPSHERGSHGRSAAPTCPSKISDGTHTCPRGMAYVKGKGCKKT